MLRLILGDRGERIAARHLRGLGYRVIGRNYRCPMGEIDIIARDGDTVVFVEVKTRSGREFGEPEEAVGPRKRRKLRDVALCYIKSRRAPMPAVRFDVVSIVTTGWWRSEVRHIKDAFEVTP